MNGAENGRLPATGIENTMGGRMLGLTKREAFAMAAMQGLLANHSRMYGQRLHEAAQDAVWAADYLLAELAKDGGK